MLFQLEHIRTLFKNKHVVIMGDSVQRCVYKDFILALQEERNLTPEELKSKGEETFCNDVLVFRSEMNNGRAFVEVREYQSEDGFYLVHFYFLTRCYSNRVEAILRELQGEPPDLIIMNSCMWDISRYGPKGEDFYYKNMNKLCTRLREVLPPTTMFIWTTTLPIASEIASGFLLEDIKFLAGYLRVAVLEANYFVTQIVAAYGFDVLDLNYYMRALMDHRENDGVHWDGFAHRHMTNMIAMFLHDSWGIPLPNIVVEELKKCETDMDLRHFTFNHAPSFVQSSKMRLERLEAGEEYDGVTRYTMAEEEEEDIEEYYEDDGTPVDDGYQRKPKQNGQEMENDEIANRENIPVILPEPEMP